MAKTEKLAAYYKPEEHGDIKGKIRKLRQNKGTIYQGRSESEVIRMLIVERLDELSEELAAAN